MIFNSIEFLIFFPIVVLLYFAIPKKIKPAWLLLASYYFYMSWSAKYAILILISTVITYLSGLLMAKVEKKKWIVALSFISNLGILFFFKYFNFIIDNINRGIHFAGIDKSIQAVELPMIVGISFYTFQALSYTVDVYRGTIKPEKNFINYALFVSFFPQLVAGPIERSGNLLSQIQMVSKQRLFNYQKIVSGFSLMCYGMFIKVVLADHLAALVDSIWDNLQMVGLVEGIVAMVAFSFQIYCDFSAYSAIAIGAARVMGFDLMENFNTPYLATSIKDFWRRWHISLSTWFRDYLYIPLGGNRKGKIRKYLNLMITFLVSGLWHGANWTYIIWGGMHGLMQVIGDILHPLKMKIGRLLKVNEEAESFKIGQICITFCLTSIAWVFFRAPSIREALRFFKYMILNRDYWSLFDERLFSFGLDRIDFEVTFVALLVLIVFDLIRYFKSVDAGEFLARQNLWFRWVILIAFIVGTIIYGAYGIDFDSAQFLYFQF